MEGGCHNIPTTAAYCDISEDTSNATMTPLLVPVTTVSSQIQQTGKTVTLNADLSTDASPNSK